VSEADQITELLAGLDEGAEAGRDKMIAAIYRELRRVAAAQLRHERRDHTLQPTALVHEACIRLLNRPAEWRDREHLYRTAAKIMRQILTDYARARSAEKRQADRPRVPLSEEIQVSAAWSALSLEDVIALNDAIEKLKAKDPRQSVVVDLRFFA
jgi:RNA polymerase sigma factor (TIGR02999 family)